MSLIPSNDNDYVQTLHKVANEIQNAEYILVAGMSASCGPNYYAKDDPIYL